MFLKQTRAKLQITVVRANVLLRELMSLLFEQHPPSACTALHGTLSCEIP